MGKRQITIVLEPKNGLIPLPSFRTAIEQLTVLLNEVSSKVSEPKPSHISWGLSELSLNSPAKIGVECVGEEVEEMARRTAIAVIGGLDRLQREQVRPEYFNDNALESAQRLARLTIDNLARVNIYSDIPDQQVYLSEQISVNVTGILESLDYDGSVDGKLELISGREGNPLYFRVQDRINNVSVRCDISDELVETALQSFRKRVIVYGVIKSDNNGIPRRIRASSIEIIPEEGQLPQAEDIIEEIKGHSSWIAPYERKP